MTKNIQKLYRFDVDQSGRVEELNHPTALAIANVEHDINVLLKPKVKAGISKIRQD